jgi:hypothetical protein
MWNQLLITSPINIISVINIRNKAQLISSIKPTGKYSLLNSSRTLHWKTFFVVLESNPGPCTCQGNALPLGYTMPYKRSLGEPQKDWTCSAKVPAGAQEQERARAANLALGELWTSHGFSLCAVVAWAFPESRALTSSPGFSPRAERGPAFITMCVCSGLRTHG